jgi:hypothetical protein
MHPEYPSQAAIIAALATGILELCSGRPSARLRDHRSYRPEAETGVPVHQGKWLPSSAHARIWGGIHFRNSLEVSEDMGRKIAAYMVENAIKQTR